MGDVVMVKLRLDYFLMRGGLLNDGDFINSGARDNIRVTPNNKNLQKKKYAEFYTIESFAPRKNNGSQPVPDDFPVLLIESGCTPGFKASTAGNAEWQCSWYATWRPDIEKLTEQQIEYDKQQDKAVHCNRFDEAIEELIINAKGNNMPIYTQEMKESGKFAPIGSKVQIVNNSSFDLEYGEEILGLELTVLSGEILTRSGLSVQAVEYEGIAYCFETDMIFPFKSQEEIEMEEAKAKQVGDFYEKYESYRHFVAQGNLTGFIRLMQENGDLAEIILPLESK